MWSYRCTVNTNTFQIQAIGETVPPLCTVWVVYSFFGTTTIKEEGTHTF